MKQQRSDHKIHPLHIPHLWIHIHYCPEHPAESLPHRLLAEHRILRERAYHILVDLVQLLHTRFCSVLYFQILQLIFLKIEPWEVNSEPIIAPFANLGKF